MAAQDAAILRNGEILIVGREMTLAPILSTRVRLSWIDADGQVSREVFVDRESEGRIRIVGESTTGEIILGRHEAGSVAVYRLSPHGEILARLHIDGLLNEFFWFGPDNRLWMVWESVYFRVLNISDISSVGPVDGLQWNLDLE